MELPDRDERDDEAAALLALLMLGFHGELIALLGDPPQADNVPAEFWERVQSQTADRLAEIALVTFIAAARLHGAEDPEREALANEAGVSWSARHATRIAELLNGTSRELLARFILDWQRRRAAGETIPQSETSQKLGRIFGEDRAVVIASDAVTSAQTAGGEWAVDQFGGLSRDDVWLTAADERVCPVCVPLDGEPRRVWAETFPDGPPAHPLCRCAVLYVSMPTS